MTSYQTELARALDRRRKELRLTWRQVAKQAGVSAETIRQLRMGEPVSDITKKGVEDALRLPDGGIDSIIAGEDPGPAPDYGTWFTEKIKRRDRRISLKTLRKLKEDGYLKDLDLPESDEHYLAVAAEDPEESPEPDSEPEEGPEQRTVYGRDGTELTEITIRIGGRRVEVGLDLAGLDETERQRQIADAVAFALRQLGE